MKKFIVTLTVMVVIAGAAYLYFFQLSPIEKNNPLNAVPASAAIIICLEEPLEHWKEMTTNRIWDYLKTNPVLASFGKSVDSLNTEIKKNEGLWSLVANRPIILSYHPISNTKYNFLLTCDLQKATQFSFLKNYLDKIIGDDAKIYNRKYLDTEIIEFSYYDSPEIYYLTLVDNLLLFSTTHTLIEEALMQKSKPVMVRDLDFVEVSKYMDVNSPTIYFHQLNFKTLLEQFTTSDAQKDALQFLTYSDYLGLNFNMGDDYISIHGYSDEPTDQDNMVQALLKSGKGEINLGAIVPENASSFTSLGFNDATSFYTNFEQLLNDEDGEYESNKKRLEKYLGISIEDNIISWIDNEIGLIQLNSSSNKHSVELAIAFRYNDIDALNENLDYIERKIRRKTPVKFKGIDYKGYQIKFLSIKGLFKLVFGKMFSSIEKPYYVILGDYIVFSNSPKTLGKIITATVENKTLNSTKEYAEFMEEFKHESNLFLYVSAEELLTDARNLLDSESWSALAKHRKYIEGFPLLGIQLFPENGLLSYHLQMKHLNNIEQEKWNSLLKELSMITDDEANEGEIIDDDYIIAVENILPEDLNDKKLTQEFANGQLKFEVSLKDGLKHGRYSEYDSLGNLIIKGRYKEDKKVGTWKFYDSNGELIKKIKE
ncbi:MAG: DUF3352 domain-containing protein [Fulvivirga sp.]|uniref:DUF3352 domain-containing protein n=1 Tax=Fulvivirga sp. TaxID=1931237 RepID=UPI0032EE0775